MSAPQLVQLALMAFVLLAPLAMVGVLLTGLARRGDSADEPGPHLGGLLVADGVRVSVEHHDDRAVAQV
jgi:hypothetical protein